MSNNTIFVTGGAGFIGSHLCTLLVGKGENVICIDNLVTGNKDNIESLLNESNFTFINADIREKEWIQELKLEELHEIYDLASPASVTRITEHPIEAATVNAVGLLNLLDLAVKHKAKLLFASSSEAYGDPKEHPQKESYWGNVNPVGVRSGYDEGKRFGESLCMAYMR
ncbi:MAG: GDP-mannose 4,6-dehydratase, partial [bacterium]|nr:GDP-mannose 4,6-dehydratase [bacterium]